jgi:hypothetical protein
MMAEDCSLLTVLLCSATETSLITDFKLVELYFNFIIVSNAVVMVKFTNDFVNLKWRGYTQNTK